MTFPKINISTDNWYKKTRGNRDYPFVFFYIFPMLTYSQVDRSAKNFHIGWLFFSILITIR